MSLRAFYLVAFLAIAAPSQAQQGHLPEGFDFDTLAACAIVYQRVGEIYATSGDTVQSTQFKDTGFAFSASAYHVLKYLTDSQDEAFAFAESRMTQVTDGLNAGLEAVGGEMAVIEQWLPYCDTLGPGVSEILAKREMEGW